MAFKRSAVRSRLSPPRQKALKTRCFQGFSSFTSGTKQRAFFGCARASHTPIAICVLAKESFFNLFSQNVGPLFCVFPLRFYQVIPLWKISSHWFGASFLIRVMASSSVRLRTIQSISAYPASWQSFWRRWPDPSHRPHTNRRWWAGPLTATLCYNFNG